MRSLLRWAGSKRRLLPTLLTRMPLFSGRYVEPFAGSACLFFALEPGRGVLGDINAELIQAYSSMRNSPEAIWSGLSRLGNAKATYYQLRSIDPHSLSTEEQAVRFFYLNRFCFNGVYRTNKSGLFNVPRGEKTGAFPSLNDFRKCAELLQCATLVNIDFEDTLRGATRGDFVYLDPPYFKPGRQAYGEYGYGRFDSSDLSRLFESLQRLDQVGSKFLMSYSGSAVCQPELKRWNVSVLNVRRHVAGFAAARASVTEILVSNY
jgi:DNA adenine methylase